MPQPRLILIAAVAQNGVIGQDNTLPWRLKADMRFFRATTMGHPIIMGRHTWNSLGKPLPGRRNIVLSYQAGLALTGAEVFSDFSQALSACESAEKIFVIGGAQLYKHALPLADQLLITEVHANVPGDAFFPPIPRTLFREVSRTSHPADGENEFAMDFVSYRRQPESNTPH